MDKALNYTDEKREGSSGKEVALALHQRPIKYIKIAVL